MVCPSMTGPGRFTTRSAPVPSSSSTVHSTWQTITTRRAWYSDGFQTIRGVGARPHCDLGGSDAGGAPTAECCTRLLPGGCRALLELRESSRADRPWRLLLLDA